VLVEGQATTLTIDKAAAGGRMIARDDGQIVLVAGAIPGERVTARISRVAKGVAFADTVSVEVPSADRRTVHSDPSCGGCLYAHIAYPRQLAIKGQVIADALLRIGRIPLEAEPRVAASPETGYRMRARLHLRAGHTRAGFFREGTHEACDPRGTRQLLPATCDAIDRLARALRSLDADAAYEIDVSENIDASCRAVHLDIVGPVVPGALLTLPGVDGLSGLTIGGPAVIGRAPSAPATVIFGEPYVTDRLNMVDGAISLRRHVLSFFQGNRFLLTDLVAHVAAQVDAGNTVIDLYAGVGVFALAAAKRGAQVTAVEGDRVAALDLAENAGAAGGGLETVHQDVEQFTRRSRQSPDALIVDPPRTGLSKEALAGVIGLNAPRLIYVSCDVATLARDSRRLVDAGYTLRSVQAFDLFPNTPHVETVVRFEAARGI
jgi:23S rRNA (uracil1939-C5)-methyltransferase